MINYEVPFYSNTPDGTHCFQASIRMVLKFFLPEKDFTWEELEKVTAKVEGLWTWPMAGLLWLQKNGFEVKDIEPFDYSRFAQEGGSYLIELFGKEVGEAQIKHSNVDQELEFAKQLVEEIRPEVRVPTSQDIEDLLLKGYLVICCVNSRALNNKEGYVGHFVVVKGFNDNGFMLHDPGSPPQENRKVDLDVFERAWAYPNEQAKNIMAFKLKPVEVVE